MGAQGHPVLTPPPSRVPPSTLLLRSGCYLSIFTLFPSTDRPRPTYVHSPNDKWTHAGTHTYTKSKYTITDVDND